MQLDYYRSPCPDNIQAPEPTPPVGEGQPRRQRRGRLVLILFSILIPLLAAAIVVLHLLFPNGWHFPLEQFLQPSENFEFHFEIPGDIHEDFDASWTTSNTVTTIPRADPAPQVQLLLAQPPEQELSFQKIYEKVIPSIVSIQAYSSSDTYGGTGVVMTEDGYIITNHHIIAGCSSAEILLPDGTQHEAKLVGSDAESDLAILKIDATDLAPAEFGNSDLLQVGDIALAIGNPLGSEFYGTMTEGIISSIRRDVNVNGYNMSLIQTTAALNSGNSGGALLNCFGQVVGITNMKMMSDYETIEGLGFAVPTVWAKEVADLLLARGAITGRPTIGITCFALQTGDNTFYDQSNSIYVGGVYVDSVTAHGPADLAGIRPGDIILSVNNCAVVSLEDLTAVRDDAGVGGTLAMTVWRDGEILELTLTLVEQHELN